MSKRPAAKKVSAKKPTVAKPKKAATKSKSTATKRPVAKSKLIAKKKTEKPKMNLMWKILEAKKKEQHEGPKAKHPFAHVENKASEVKYGAKVGHARFNGPRRKAA